MTSYVRIYGSKDLDHPSHQVSDLLPYQHFGSNDLDHPSGLIPITLPNAMT